MGSVCRSKRWDIIGSKGTEATITRRSDWLILQEGWAMERQPEKLGSNEQVGGRVGGLIEKEGGGSEPSQIQAEWSPEDFKQESEMIWIHHLGLCMCVCKFEWIGGRRWGKTVNWGHSKNFGLKIRNAVSFFFFFLRNRNEEDWFY